MRRVPACLAVVIIGLACASPGHRDARQLEPSGQAVVGASKTIFVLAPTGFPTAAITTKLTAWGKLALSDTRNDADLVLEVRRVDVVRAHSEFGADDAHGVPFSAELVHRQSGVRVWSTTRSTSNGSMDVKESWAGRMVADELIRFLDTALGRKGRG